MEEKKNIKKKEIKKKKEKVKIIPFDKIDVTTATEDEIIKSGIKLVKSGWNLINVSFAQWNNLISFIHLNNI